VTPRLRLTASFISGFAAQNEVDARIFVSEPVSFANPKNLAIKNKDIEIKCIFWD
jgi:hypothetical protein